MADSVSGTDTESSRVGDLSIEEAVDEVESIITSLEDSDVNLAEAKDLRDRADELIDHIETELEVGDGEVNRVEP